MDDRLQRRLRDADPLTVGDGRLPDPARLDAIKEQLMQSEDPARSRPAFRPRALGLVGVVAASLALVLAVGTLVRPAGTALAWAPEPAAVSDEQKAAAEKACTENVVVGSGTIQGGGGIVEGQRRGGSPARVIPAPITTVPPLVSLELHGNGGVGHPVGRRPRPATACCAGTATTFTAGGLALGMGVPAGFEDGFLVERHGHRVRGPGAGHRRRARHPSAPRS